MKYRITELADRDLEEIWQFIALRDVTAADRVEEKLHATLKLLAQFPGMGHTRADVADSRYRFWAIYSYLVAYRLEGDEVVVIRVVHGSRDLPSALNQ